jgi:4-hydroxybenzoate polyprenyltransferase
LRICDFLFVLRPVILIPAWSFYLLGAAQGGGMSPLTRGLPTAAAVLSLTAILITAYLLNQIFDRESDEKNNKCLFLARGVVTVRALVVLAVAAFLSASLAYHRVEDVHRPPLIAAVALAFAYSLPPLRFCARPILDLLANAVGYGGIAFILGFGIFDPTRAEAVRASLPYILMVASAFLHTAILDVDGDRATGKTSTTVLIGTGASRVAAAVLHGCAFVLALGGGGTTAAVVTGVSLPIAVYPLWRKDSASSSFVVQADTLVVMLAAAVFWPAYLLVVAPLIALSRFYHRRRFGLTYPGPATRASASE